MFCVQGVFLIYKTLFFRIIHCTQTAHKFLFCTQIYSFAHKFINFGRGWSKRIETKTPRRTVGWRGEKSIFKVKDDVIC